MRLVDNIYLANLWESANQPIFDPEITQRPELTRLSIRKITTWKKLGSIHLYLKDRKDSTISYQNLLVLKNSNFVKMYIFILIEESAEKK